MTLSEKQKQVDRIMILMAATMTVVTIAVPIVTTIATTAHAQSTNGNNGINQADKRINSDNPGGCNGISTGAQQINGYPTVNCG
jgi:hypothetical protein